MYSQTHLRLKANIRFATSRLWEEPHASNTPFEILRSRCTRPRTQSRRRLRAGQNLRAETLALGAAVASVAEIDGGVGRLDRKGVRRHHQIQGLSVAAARQGVRPLRNGARRHSRCQLFKPRLT